MDNREMNPDDEAESHRGEPQRMPEEISHSLRSPRRSEPVVTMRKIVELVRKEPAGIDYGRNEQREGQTKLHHEPQMRSATHPAVGPTVAVKMGGNAFWQMPARRCQAAEEAQIEQSDYEYGRAYCFHRLRSHLSQRATAAFLNSKGMA